MTTYALVENGIVTFGPNQLPKNWRHVSGLDLATPSALKDLGWLPVEEVLGSPTFDQELDGYNWVILTSKVQHVAQYRTLDAGELTQRLSDKKVSAEREVAEVRFDAETDGMTLSNGRSIRTNREAQTQLNGAVFEASQDGAYTIDWRFKEGWFNLNAANLLSMSREMRDFIQSKFDIAKVHDDAINALTTVQDIEDYLDANIRN